MPRNYLIFGDIEGKLEVLRVECTKCARKGRVEIITSVQRRPAARGSLFCSSITPLLTVANVASPAARRFGHRDCPMSP
jgi:hypothetical protein